jgi:hypothetical protein
LQLAVKNINHRFKVDANGAYNTEYQLRVGIGRKWMLD